MRVIAIETSTDACSCALLLEGESRCVHRVAPRRHAELILSMVSKLLDEAGTALHALDAVAFGRGPGAFTGVRIAAAVAQGLAFGAGLPVVPVSTLAALARGAFRERGEQRVLAVMDARMGEVYWGAFEAAGEAPVAAAGGERVGAPERVAVSAGGRWFGTGSGFAAHAAILRETLGEHVVETEPARLPHALDVAELGAEGMRRGEAVEAAAALPVYLRERVAGPAPVRGTR